MLGSNDQVDSAYTRLRNKGNHRPQLCLVPISYSGVFPPFINMVMVSMCNKISCESSQIQIAITNVLTRMKMYPQQSYIFLF